MNALQIAGLVLAVCSGIALVVFVPLLIRTVWAWVKKKNEWRAIVDQPGVGGAALSEAAHMRDLDGSASCDLIDTNVPLLALGTATTAAFFVFGLVMFMFG